jgi:hypothetical protein
MPLENETALAPRAGRKEWIGLAVSALSAAGLGILTQLDTASGLPVAVIGSIVFALGLGPVFILTTDLIVGTAPPERAGASSAMSGTGAESGGALGIAILGSIGAAVYRSDVVDAVPDGVPLASADAARDTLGGALVVAQSSRAASARGSSMPHSLRSRKDCSCRPASVPSLRSGSPPSSWPSYATSPTGAVPATRHGSAEGGFGSLSRRVRNWDSLPSAPRTIPRWDTARPTWKPSRGATRRPTWSSRQLAPRRNEHVLRGV